MLQVSPRQFIAISAFLGLFSAASSGIGAELNLSCPKGREAFFECPSIQEVKVVRIKKYGVLRSIEALQDSLLCGMAGIENEDRTISMNIFTRHLWKDFMVEDSSMVTEFETESYFIAEIRDFLDPNMSKTKLGFSRANTSYGNDDRLDIKIDKDKGVVDFHLRLERHWRFWYGQELHILYEDCIFFR